MNRFLIPEQYNIIWGTSWIALFPTIHALKKKKYDLALCSGSVFLTSLNYWRNPVDSWRLLLDLFVVRTACVYQSYNAIHNRKYSYFFWTTLAGLSFFIGKNKYYNENRMWTYTYFHLGLHIFANIGNFALLE